MLKPINMLTPYGALGGTQNCFIIIFLSCYHKLAKSLPMDTMSFPQVSKFSQQDTKLFPQYSKSLCFHIHPLLTHCHHLVCCYHHLLTRSYHLMVLGGLVASKFGIQSQAVTSVGLSPTSGNAEDLSQYDPGCFHKLLSHSYDLLTYSNYLSH